MSEKELINQYSEFGYLVKKYGDKYSIFDRRLGRRTAEAETFEQLSDYAEKILLFPFMAEILNKTIDTFSEMYSRMYPETAPDTVPETVPEMVAGEKQDQEQAPAPVSPVTDQDMGKEIPVYDLICKGCGKPFQSTRKKSYCSEACYPSNQGAKVFERPI